MEKVVLTDIDIGGTLIEKLHVFLDGDNRVIILPLLWSLHLNNSGQVYQFEKITDTSLDFLDSTYKVHHVLREAPVSENTIESYISKVFKFFQYVNAEYNTDSNKPSVHHSELIRTEHINNFLNCTLPMYGASNESLKVYKAAIQSYFNFLLELELVDYTPIVIYRKTRRKVAHDNPENLKINYISREVVSSIIRNANSKRDRLIIRMGLEVGLRSSENTGLVLADFKAKASRHPGLLELFNQFKTNPTQSRFRFLLSGIFTKGGKSRFIYFDRQLLSAMIDYYETERKAVLFQSKNTCNSFFIRYDYVGMGMPIGAHHASKVFRKIVNGLSHVDKSLCYHDLRHTFATELFAELLIDNEGYENRSESAALLNVQQRLGHSNKKSSIRYIKLHQMLKNTIVRNSDD